MAKRRTDKEIRFEDIPKLTDREIQLLLREVDTRDLATAMNRASKALRNRIFSNVSTRVEELIKEEMEFSDQLEASEVEAVQRGIAQAAQELKEVGQIAWPSSKAAPTRKPKLSKKYSSMKRSIVTTTQRPLSMLNFDEINQLFVELTEIARREGVFELEKLVPDISDEFLKSAVSSAVDGIEPELLQEILENWVESLLQEQEVKYQKIIEGVMSIQSGDSPRIVGLKLEKLF